MYFYRKEMTTMAMFMRVEEVAEEVGISIPYAYKQIQKFFHEKFYCTRQQEKEENKNSSI